jgi:hypothetical protein
MDGCDAVTVTCDPLADYYSRKFGIPRTKFRVIPNYLPRYFFDSYDETVILDRIRSQKSRKPRICFSCGMSHFDMRNTGAGDDFSGIIDWIVQNRRRYQFIFHGGFPPALEKFANDFKRIPVDGSTKMPDAHMDAIEPFDYSEMVPFSMGYLPGYVTDRYDQDAKMCEDRMRTRVENTCVDELENTVSGYSSVSLKHADARMSLDDVAYALLPVWMLHTRWNDEDYLFAMNGQTGKLVGDLPIDNGKMIRYFLLIFIPMVVVLGILVGFIFGYGV